METPTLAFVPGFMQRGDAWAAVADRLAERYPSVLLDSRRTSSAAAPARCPVGYSMGGRIAAPRARSREPGALAGARARRGERGRRDDPRGAARRRRGARRLDRDAADRGGRRALGAQPVFATQSAGARRRAARGPAVARPGASSRSSCARSARARCRRSGTACRSSSCRCCCLAGALDEKYAPPASGWPSLLPRGHARARSPTPGHAPQLEEPDAVGGRRYAAFLDERL